MEGVDPRSPYHRTDYRSDIPFPGEQLTTHDRPRPASARDLGHSDMYDSGIHPHSSSPRLNQPFVDNPGGGLGLEGRAASLDRRAELYGTLRGNYDAMSERLPGHHERSAYALKSLSSNPGLAAVLRSGGTQQRRAHSYDMNLEKQGLADYNNLLAAAGIGTNPILYGNPANQLLDYSGLTAPTLSSLGGIDYAALQRPAAYPTFPAATGIFNLGTMPDVTLLQRECIRLQHELELTREKLNACTTSIRTFWSPELKRERAMRKEENAKYAILADHLHQLQLEKQTMLETLHNMETDLRRERDYRIRGRFSTERGSEGLSELDMAKRQNDELTVENRQLKKAVEEADRRTANVKASLTATEESLRRLVEAVKAGKAAASSTTGTTPSADVAGVTATEAGPASNIRLERIEADRAEINRLRTQLSEACTRGSEAERQLIERNYEFSRMKEEFNLLLQDHQQLKMENETIRQDIRQTQTLQSLVDTKVLDTFFDRSPRCTTERLLFDRLALDLSAPTHTSYSSETMIESKIMTLENEIRLLEDEITRLRDDGLITPNTSTSSGIDDLDKTLQAFRSNERLLKSKVEMLNGEISKRDCEIYTLQSRLEMTDKQQQDQTHHINVLKEQVKTREHKISMLTADTEDFRKRIKEKETQLEKKTKSLTAAQAAKRQTETEMAELKDQLDIKERKLALLQRKRLTWNPAESLVCDVSRRPGAAHSVASKHHNHHKREIQLGSKRVSRKTKLVENLEDLLNDKDTQLAASKARLSRISTERLGTDFTRIGLEESLKDKEKQIERLQDLSQRSAAPDSADELNAQKRLTADLRGRLEATQRDLDEKATQLLEFREELSELRTNRFKHEAEISQLQAQLNQRASEFATLQMEKQMQHKQITTECEMKYGQRIGELEGQVNHYMDTNSKMQSEIDRLLRNLDSEKFEKEKQLRELQEELREAQNNLSNLKRTQQAERKKQTQLLEETRQREENAHSDVEILKSIMSEKEARIRELEQALRESVRITAEREVYASGRDDETRHMEQQMRELRSNVEQLQRERNHLSAQMAAIQEELSDREGQLKTLEQECFQNYLPELEKLRRSNHEANMRVAAMVKLTQGREHTLTDQDRHVLASIPLFPNISPSGPWSTTIGATGSRMYMPGYHSGGATSPHLAGSAFQLIGNAASAIGTAAGGRASVPGQSMASPDVILLSRMLQEKESTIQQHMQELTHLRFQNSEQEIRLKAMQRELDAKTTRLSILEATQYSAMSRLDTGTKSPTSFPNELAQLRKSNHELSVKFAQLQIELDDKERQLRAMERMQTSLGTRSGTDYSETALLRRELITVKAEKDAEILNLSAQLEKVKQEKSGATSELQEIRSALGEKSNQMRALEAEKDKEAMDRESLQKKYEVVLTQLGEKTDKLQHLESECNSKHIEELQRQKSELNDLRHHITYLQNTIQERESRIETVEKESFKLRDEINTMRKQLSSAEAEAKSLREEVTYREERLRQLQTQHMDELTRLRSINQEQVTRCSHLEMKLDEKDHEIKSQASEMRCQTDEISRLQSSLEDANSRLSVSQKRVEEREMRLRKLESENHDLLDEIHGLRKGNTELESQVDSLRQRLLDHQDRPGSTVPISGIPAQSARVPPTTFSSTSSLTANRELERTRKQYIELTSTHEQLKKQFDDLQIQHDQLTVQRNNLRTQLDEEIGKRAKLEERLRSTDEEWRAKMAQTENSEQSRRASLKISELHNELERKEAQITCLTKELERQQSSSAMRDRLSDSTSQQLLLADLQVRLRQVTEERDQAKEQLNVALSHAETSYVDAQQQIMLEKQTLQQQVANLTQTVSNASAEAERYQREARQASSRIQQLSRQLQETQDNCDSIARQRDNLRDQLDQLRRSGGRSATSGVSSVANLFGMRPASAGPGSYENLGPLSASGSASQLSRELDRVHREYEATQGQLRAAQDAEQSAKAEAQQLREQVAKLKNDLEQQEKKVRELQEHKEAMEKDMAKRQQEEMERTQFQQNETNEKLRWAQQQLADKTNQVENITHQLNNTRQYCSELEMRINDMTQRLGAAEAKTQKQATDMQNYQQLQNECNSLRNELKVKESETGRGLSKSFRQPCE
ncbi:hypothetical protein T265_03134 [Opisthorchis viverrini]|uniref:Uncharacterized protein n=1 Tax=Opisthorchis viverrini TaxID=6198 RepID=A0A074ZSJ8_OPIVI|nr:hypothetical protein T265_03134 [Opisthorchis viverrini]KER30398.1 hypothetical protein T265_03134 [Opisthorchis viverrini]